MQHSLHKNCWAWVRQQSEFTLAQLADHLTVDSKTARELLLHLISEGRVKYHRQGYLAKYYKVDNAKVTRSQVRQRIWQAIRFTTSFTIDDIVATTDASRSTVERYVSKLKKQGYVSVTTQINKSKTSPKQRLGKGNRYLLIKNTGHKAPNVVKGVLVDVNTKQVSPTRQRIWQTLNQSSAQSIYDIAELSECASKTVEKYIILLRQYGYVQNLPAPKGLPGTPRTKLKVINNTGPLCPVVKKGQLFDQNLNEYAQKEPAK